MPDSSPYLLPEKPFTFLVEQECKRALRYTHFFSILMVRLDSTGLNDPDVIGMANVIQGEVRGSDVLGTLHDNDLAVILHHADAQNTDEIAARVRGSIQIHYPRLQPDREYQTIRIGGACFPSHAHTAEDLLKIALERSLH